MICLPRIAVLSCFGRETSLVNIMGLRSIPSSLFTRSIYFLLLLSSSYHYYPSSLAFDPFVNNKAGEITNLSELPWEQSYLLCVKVPSTAKFLAPLSPTYRFRSPTG